MSDRSNRWRIIFLLGSILSWLVSACQPSIIYQTATPAISPDPQVMVTFRVSLPATLPPGEQLILIELDDVTGLGFNQKKHIMEAEDSQHFIAILPLRINSEFKYRYTRQGEFTNQEFTTDGRPVRYRLLYANTPALIQDIVSRWADAPKQVLPLGRIIGQAFRADDNTPIPNLLITAGGQQTWTGADGGFFLEGLPEGTHNLVAYAADSSYQTFQQGARVSAGAATEANLRLEPAKIVKITFEVTVPANTPQPATLRMAGNLWQLGNSFTALRGGLNSTATRLPSLKLLENGKYGITLNLGTGCDLQYKYTLGDSIWNAEQSELNQFLVRHLIIPDHDITIRDEVIRWEDSSRLPVTFKVNVPAVTPKNEFVSIQFNPGYAWLEAIPMWSVGPNVWEFTLFSPLRGLETIQYRYCRAAQCGSADATATAGRLATGQYADLTSDRKVIQDTVESWAWMSGAPEVAVVPNLSIPPRDQNFVAGIALQEGYHPSWMANLDLTLNDIRSLNSNTIVLFPTWTVVRSNPPFQEGLPGNELTGFDLTTITNLVRSQGFRTIYFPVSHYTVPANVWWQEATRDFPWWVSWYERYSTFIRQTALQAAQTGTEALVLGDINNDPALPNGRLSDGASSNTPEDTIDRWRKIIQEIRQVYPGQIWWALQFPQDFQDPPAFLDGVDGIYVLWSAPLVSEAGNGLEFMTQQAASQLDNLVLPLQQRINKPVILALAYPSAQNGSTGCLPGLEAGCLDLGLLSPPNPDIPNIGLNLADQENAYNAMFLAVKDRPWITGVVSTGYYPPAALQDKSISIHGKPARGVLWFWFGRFLGK